MNVRPSTRISTLLRLQLARIRLKRRRLCRSPLPLEGCDHLAAQYFQREAAEDLQLAIKRSEEI
jgi:hypothetical protein